MQRCWEELANAIVLQAVKDYRWARAVLRKKPDDELAGKVIRDTVRFFRSRWFGTLTKVDRKYLMEQLRKEKRNDEE